MWSFFWCFRIRVVTPLLLQWVKRNITLWNNLQRTVFLFILALRDVILFSFYSKIKVTYSCSHELSLEMSQLLWGVSQLVNTTLGCHSYSFSGLVRWSKQAGLWSFSRAAQQTSGCRLHLTSPETLEQWKEALESVWRGRSVTAAQTVPEQTSPDCLRVNSLSQAPITKPMKSTNQRWRRAGLMRKLPEQYNCTLCCSDRTKAMTRTDRMHSHWFVGSMSFTSKITTWWVC